MYLAAKKHKVTSTQRNAQIYQKTYQQTKQRKTEKFVTAVAEDLNFNFKTHK